jgi:hypothetical protein
MSLDNVYQMSFFINLFKTTPKNPEVVITAANTKKAAITKEREEKHRDIDEIISAAEAELSKAEPDKGTTDTGATANGTSSTDASANGTSSTATGAPSKIGGKSKKKKKFSNKQNGGKNKKRAKSQKKRR